MSICIADIRAQETPKQGTIRPGIDAELRLGVFATHLEMPVPPDQRADYMRRKIIARLYGDIAQDFEEFLQSLGAADPFPGRAGELCERIRTKLRGEGHGEQPHQAPP